MIKTEAIVLAVTPYSETSLVTRLLTRQAGVARALAKGARSPKSRLHGVLEPFARVEAQLHRANADKLGTLGETTLLESWPCLRGDLARLGFAALGVEVIGHVAEASPPDPFFYEEACRFLAMLGLARGAGSLAIALLLRLLHHGGFPPRWADGAPPCAEALAAPGAAVAYDFAEGSLSILPGGRIEPPGAMRLPGRAMAAILGALAAPPRLDMTFELRAEDGPPLLRWLVRAWEDHLCTRLKSAVFLEKMALALPSAR
jgi:DNA repair protein RecO (recombination protein O)